MYCCLVFYFQFFKSKVCTWLNGPWKWHTFCFRDRLLNLTYCMCQNYREGNTLLLYGHLVLGVGWDWAQFIKLPQFVLSLKPRMIYDDECGAIGGTIDSRNRSTPKTPAAVPLCPPQIPCKLIWARTRATAVRSRRLWPPISRKHTSVGIKDE
jgi:hypothetical protein